MTSKFKTALLIKMTINFSGIIPLGDSWPSVSDDAVRYCTRLSYLGVPFQKLKLEIYLKTEVIISASTGVAGKFPVNVGKKNWSAWALCKSKK